MTIFCICGHPKSKHENTLDYGRNSGGCNVRNCPCSHELFGFKEMKEKC